ncbi:agamous-like MADS-box protein AGL61 [Magnolia sinica]|uniref:agamous-like MADS-box protein AGL61 n=1 Tax=Magnolia sinica TaxID=86752 RepID=UPI00265B534B|nr:agamous-like MADS-box protein AGL61 [Magnolia sinica]
MERKGKGKRKREMALIEDKNSRMVCFSKRRKGLFKKAAVLCHMHDTQIAIFVSSPAGNPFLFGHPSVDAVLDRYLADSSTHFVAGVGDVTAATQHSAMSDQITELERQLSIENMCREMMLSVMKGEVHREKVWWDSLEMEEMERSQSVLEKFKENVLARLNEMSSELYAAVEVEEQRLLDLVEEEGSLSKAEISEEMGSVSTAGIGNLDDEEGIFSELSPLNLGYGYSF